MTKFGRFLFTILLFAFLAPATPAKAADTTRPVKDGDTIVVDGKTYKVRVMEPAEYSKVVEAKRKADEAEKEVRDRAAKGPHHGFYRETKYGIGLPIVSGIYYQAKRAEDNFYITLLRGAKSFWGYHNDRLVLGTFSMSFMAPYYGAGKDPDISLGLGIAPVGLRLFGHKKLEDGDSGIYLLPTYTYLTGVNGEVVHRHAFGVELTIFWVR